MTDGKDEEAPQEEGDDALWQLLERAPRPKPVSPYFTRRVLREVALRAETRPAAGGMSSWLARVRQAWRRQPRWAFTGALAAMMMLTIGGVGLSSLHRHSPSVPVAPAVPDGEEIIPPNAMAELDPRLRANAAPSPDPVVTAQDVEIIADLDNVLSREESRLWTEDDTARF